MSRVPKLMDPCKPFTCPASNLRSLQKQQKLSALAASKKAIARSYSLADDAVMSGSTGLLSQRLKLEREAFLDANPDGWKQDYFSAAVLIENKVLRRMTLQAIQGKVLDAGCGRGTWRPLLESAGCHYQSIDVASRGSFQPDFLGDICRMDMIKDETFDSLICHQVLEHVRQPWMAAREFLRILRPGGMAVISVPHLSRYHEWPHDYFRYTVNGLDAIFGDAGFRRKHMEEYGGVASFLHHQTSSILPGLICGVPVLGTISLGINALVSLAVATFDKAVGPARMPLGICSVFSKPQVNDTAA